jgi:hypothetical protein
MDFAQYVMQNPLRAGVIKDGERYAFAEIVDRF